FLPLAAIFGFRRYDVTRNDTRRQRLGERPDLRLSAVSQSSASPSHLCVRPDYSLLVTVTASCVRIVALIRRKNGTILGELRGLDVQSRHVVERVESESFGLFCPELTNPLKRRQASKALEALREVVRIQEGREMSPELFVGVVVEAPDRGV